MASVTPPHSTISVKSPAQEYKGSTGIKSHVIVDLVLRVLLLATALVGLIVMVTSKQTKMIPVAPGLTVPLAAKFSHSPAFIYSTAALSVACLYSIVTIVLSVLLQVKPKGSSSKLLFHCVILDSLLLGIMASATGAAGAVAYIAYKGNSHTRWSEVCNIYASFCSHMAGSIIVSFLPPLTLLMLVWLSVFVLSKKIVR